MATKTSKTPKPSAAALAREARDEARAELRAFFARHPTRTVYTVLRSVSRSGMQRTFTLIAADPAHPGEVRNITWRAARAMGWGLDKHGALIVKGCGMDMGFHAVYELSAVVLPPAEHADRNRCLEHEPLRRTEAQDDDKLRRAVLRHEHI